MWGEGEEKFEVVFPTELHSYESPYEQIAYWSLIYSRSVFFCLSKNSSSVRTQSLRQIHCQQLYKCDVKAKKDGVVWLLSCFETPLHVQENSPLPPPEVKYFSDHTISLSIQMYIFSLKMKLCCMYSQGRQLSVSIMSLQNVLLPWKKDSDLITCSCRRCRLPKL